MRTLVVLLLCLLSLAGCSILNSHATAARDLMHECWAPGPPAELKHGDRYACLEPETEAAVNERMWACVKQLHAPRNSLQPVGTSRKQLIACMQQHGWVYEPITIDL